MTLMPRATPAALTAPKSRALMVASDVRPRDSWERRPARAPRLTAPPVAPQLCCPGPMRPSRPASDPRQASRDRMAAVSQIPDLESPRDLGRIYPWDMAVLGIDIFGPLTRRTRTQRSTLDLSPQGELWRPFSP